MNSINFFGSIGVDLAQNINGLRNNEIHNFDTRNCTKFSIAAGTETFSHVSARIWNALTSKINVNNSISKFF